MLLFCGLIDLVYVTDGAEAWKVTGHRSERSGDPDRSVWSTEHSEFTHSAKSEWICIIPGKIAHTGRYPDLSG
jgi:hypothetical protein